MFLKISLRSLHQILSRQTTLPPKRKIVLFSMAEMRVKTLVVLSEITFYELKIVAGTNSAFIQKK